MTNGITVFTNISGVDLEYEDVQECIKVLGLEDRMVSKKDTSCVQLVRELSQRSR